MIVYCVLRQQLDEEIFLGVATSLRGAEDIALESSNVDLHFSRYDGGWTAIVNDAVKEDYYTCFTIFEERLRE